MKNVILLSSVGIAILYVVVSAQQYPIMDRIANKVIAKYQQTTCEELWQKRAQKAPPSSEEQRAIQLLKSDPQIREAFIGKIAPPIANKMFDCGLIP